MMKLADPRSMLLASCLLFLSVLAGPFACNRIDTETDRVDAAHRPNLFLIVLDTVRRDRIQPCGYDKPTTPTLSRLATRATTFCRTITPGSWTAPVHASMFTGLLPSGHGLDYLPADAVEEGAWNDISRMNDTVPTLAGILAEYGYQTVIVSANPVVNDILGVTRDFEHVFISTGGAEGFPAFGTPRLGPALAKLDRQRPVLLVLNIFIAHNPYEYVPEGVGWLEPTPRTLDLFDGGGDKLTSPFSRFVRGELADSERSDLLRQIHSGYDWGVRLADQDLGMSLDILSHGGWLTNSSTLIVTSDHGEMLGEHGLLDHGGVAYRSNLDVFTLAAGPGFEAGRRVDSLVQNQDVFPTLLKAAGIEPPARKDAVALQTPEPDRRAVTMLLPNAWKELYGAREPHTGHTVAVQRDEDRVLWREGRPIVGERVPGLSGAESPAPPAPELIETTEALAREWVATTRTEASVTPELRENLRALGYVE